MDEGPQEEESSRRTDLGSSEREMRQMTRKGPGIVAMGETTVTAIPPSSWRREIGGELKPFKYRRYKDLGTGEFRYRPGQEGTRCKPCNLHGSARGRGTSCDALSPAHARPQARTTAEQLGWKGSSWAPIRDASGGRVLRHALAQSCASRRLVPTPPNSPSASARLARAGALPLHPPGCIDPGDRAQRLGAGPCRPHLPPGAERSSGSAAPASSTRQASGGPAAHRGRGEALCLRALRPLSLRTSGRCLLGDLQPRRHGAGPGQRAPQPPWSRSPAATTEGPRALDHRPRPQPGPGELLSAAGRGAAAADQREWPVQRRAGGSR